MIKKFYLFLFILIFFNQKLLGSEPIGILGAAIGAITNQKNEKLGLLVEWCNP